LYTGKHWTLGTLGTVDTGDIGQFSPSLTRVVSGPYTSVNIYIALQSRRRK